VNVEGNIGTAQAEIDTGNVKMENGISIKVKSDDITIKTESLYWEDKAHTISTEKTNEVSIERSDGTNFKGTGFSADARNQTWAFSDGISGIYFQNDDEEEESK
jgi:hypothetical protein